MKISQPLGGAIALQGFYRSIPLIHGSQGCAAFAKSLMTRHYREPISMQTTALQEMDVVFGAGKNLTVALDTIIEKHQPEIIGVLSTSLTEVAGDDLNGNLREYLKKKENKNRLIVGISLPDFKGSLESGYSKTVYEIVKKLLENKEQLPTKKVKNRVVLLPGAHLTPGDVMEIKDILENFGTETITIPDLSTSLSGHLLTGYSSLSRGGITLASLKKILTAEMTIVIGTNMEPTAKLLKQAGNIPYRIFPSLTGLEANDQFFDFLRSWRNQIVPIKYLWQRENLLDSMLDAHFYYAGKSAVVALEPDHLYGIANWLKEMGVNTKALVSSFKSPVLDRLKENVWIGDLGDLEDIAVETDLWISSSHGKKGAERVGASFHALGFPIYDQLGASLITSVGYRGTTDLTNRIGNHLMEH